MAAKQSGSILPFLDRFDAVGFSAGSSEMPERQFTRFNFEEVVVEFTQALSDNGWLTPAFDWTEWRKSAQDFMNSPQRVERAGATTIPRLLTTHIRADRFCEGYLASMFENGHFAASPATASVVDP